MVIDMATSWKDYKQTLDLSPEEQSEIDFTVELIGKVIEAREKKGLTQEELSKLCGVKQPVIARLEKAVHSPQVNTLMKILKPLGYTLTIVPSGNNDSVKRP